MRMSCPACHAELSLEVLISHEAARQAVARLAVVSLPFGALTLRYMALFRPEKRGLSIERLVRLVEELLPDIERQAITRKGRDWAAPVEAWRAAFEVVLGKRDKGTLTLPLTSHGLLYEVLSGLADKQEARAESERETDRRNRRLAGPQHGPRDLSDLADDLGTAPGSLAPVVVPAPPPFYQGPSRAALEIKARMDAGRRRTSGDPAETADQPSIQSTGAT